MNPHSDITQTEPRPPRHTPALLALTVALCVAFAGLIALGSWQIQRRAWKLDLIERVESRIHAAPVAAPGPDQWSQVTAERDEYRHVRLRGHYLSGKDTRVQAVTSLGAGFWLLSPFQADDGGVVLVNRGFIRPDWRGGAPPQAEIQVTGLLRLSEPGGGFLRHNAPAENRWYSRDVPAIAAARQLGDTAPYFIDLDSDAHAADPNQPVGGLTVTRFPNNHLQYALTWFVLALMVAGAGWRVAWEEYRLRHRHDRGP